MAQVIRTKKNLILKVMDCDCYHDERIMVYYRENTPKEFLFDMDMIIGQDRIRRMNQEMFCDWEEFLSNHKNSLPEFNYWNKI